jgi:hypothetical protein
MVTLYVTSPAHELTSLIATAAAGVASHHVEPRARYMLVPKRTTFLLKPVFIASVQYIYVWAAHQVILPVWGGGGGVVKPETASAQV